MWTAIIDHIRKRAALYLFSAVLFMTGTAFGAITVNSMEPVQKSELYSYVKEFFGQSSAGTVANPADLFFESLIHNLKFTGAMWVAGISIIGLPLIFILLFLKGAVTGFSVGFLIQQMKWDGLFLSILAILPQNVILIPVFLFTAVMSASCSIRLVKKITTRQTMPIPVAKSFLVYVGYAGGGAAAILLASLTEAFISSQLMNILINKFF
ncbi:stage II sporulation protein M [Domibacillus iocasae]|uniref:Stage II sporulation protein M n=1 Tax=Domibacillus iocasae TaxID=1714016 RepID=A0A1E7DMY2_9BACI|nr:stage II sporulation protein M [Domibacillus iocasae]OES44436.1 stage II sporulation protein M [Domibacillus iocasae]